MEKYNVLRGQIVSPLMSGAVPISEHLSRSFLSSRMPTDALDWFHETKRGIMVLRCPDADHISYLFSTPSPAQHALRFRFHCAAGAACVLSGNSCQRAVVAHVSAQSDHPADT
jgi:hypothetical protein